jgi:hypothetical protein
MILHTFLDKKCLLSFKKPDGPLPTTRVLAVLFFRGISKTVSTKGSPPFKFIGQHTGPYQPMDIAFFPGIQAFPWICQVKYYISCTGIGLECRKAQC